MRKIRKISIFLALVLLIVIAMVSMTSVVGDEKAQNGLLENANEEKNEERESTSTITTLIRDPQQVDGTAYAYVSYTPSSGNSKETSEKNSIPRNIGFLILTILTITLLISCLVYIKIYKKEMNIGKKMGLFMGFALILIVFAGLPGGASAEGDFSSNFAGGSGTVLDPYQISNVEQLQNMNLDLDAHYILINDIDASATSTWNSDGNGGFYGFEPIGTPSTEFTGTFDGNNYEITGLYTNRSIEYYVGMIGSALGAVIKNVGMIDVDVSGQAIVGGLVAYSDEGTSISNCYSTGIVVGLAYYIGGLIGYTNNGPTFKCYSSATVIGDMHVGGLIGNNYGSFLSQGATILNCYATGSVTGSWYVGGLVGYKVDNTISNSYATGSVTGTDYYVGGLVGYNHSSTISNSYAAGTVSGGEIVGGLVGYNVGSILNSYATGCVTGIGDYIGGLVGGSFEDSVSNSFWDTETSGQYSSDGGVGKTTTEMKQVATFTDTATVGLSSAWDFVDNPYDDTGIEDFWDIVDGATYPYFTWQSFAGGTGLSEDPYQIADVSHLQNMNLDLDAHYILVDDIDASVTSTWNGDGGSGYYGFEPIGTSTVKFTGVFDGDGYEILDLYLNRLSNDYIGLFGYTSGCEIKNVGLENNMFIGNNYVGGMVGCNNDYSVISNSYATGSVSGCEFVGGLVGCNSYGSSISSCHSNCSVSGYSPVGGLVGKNYDYTTISNSYATGSVSGFELVGGLVGWNYDYAAISNCYATGSVSGDSSVSVGGLVGRNYSSSVSNSFWDIETSGTESSAGGTGKTTAEMKDVVTFTDTDTVGLDTPWDFVGDPYDDTGTEDIWDIDGTNNNGYPFFSWQTVNESPIADAGPDQIAFVGEIVQFDGSNSYDPDGTIVSYDWDFDDGSVHGSGVSPTHVYSEGGEYTVTLTVEDDDGDVGLDTMIINALDFAGGTGTESDPYQISNVVQLQNMNLDLDAHYILVNDIDASDTETWNGGEGFEPVGIDSDPFIGTFDGNGYKITDLYINRPFSFYIGLFGSTYNSNIKNVGLENIVYYGNVYVGGIVGWNYGSLSDSYTTGILSGDNHVGGLVGYNAEFSPIMNCYANSIANGTGFYVGGLVAENSSNSPISDCYATEAVSGSDYVGGLVGLNYSSITNTNATGSVNGTMNYIGGLVGYNRYSSPITNCFASGDTIGSGEIGGLVGYNADNCPISNSFASGEVSGTDHVGGLVGYNENFCSISNSYAIGSVIGVNYIGGLMGYNTDICPILNSYAVGYVSGSGFYFGGLVAYNNNSPISNSFWDTETSGQSSSDGGCGKTTAEMKQQATFIGWDFVNTWGIIEDITYPFFQWHIPPEPPIADAGLELLTMSGDTLYFDGSNSYDPDGEIISYDWDFGDGSAHGSGVTTSHSYSGIGEYLVTLTVIDNNGNIGQDSFTIFFGIYNVDKDLYYPTIQNAIDDADSANTIRVGCGVYYENLVVDKPLTLMGVTNNVTILQGEGNGHGIYVNGQSGVAIQNLNINGFEVGINLSSSSYNSISGNEIFNCYQGISLSSSSDNTMIGNEISGSVTWAIRIVTDSNGNHITTNALQNNAIGLGIHYDCYSNHVNDNVISGNDDYGISIASGSFLNYVYGNNVFNNLKNGIQIDIDSTENYIYQNTIENNNKNGIHIQDSDSNSVFENIISGNSMYGFYLINANDSYISCNEITNNQGDNILIESENCTINDNVITDNGGFGIYLRYSDYCIVTYNTVERNNYGISVEGNINSIMNNKVTYNQINGISLTQASSNILKENTVTFNNNGISLSSNSNNNEIERNTISFNNIKGITLSSSNDNVIFHNNFIYNTDQVYTLNSTNAWDNGAGEGNYWSDYTGLDDGSDGRVPGDGIGDTDLPHQGVDYYPLMHSKDCVHNIDKDLYYDSIGDAILDADFGNTIKVGYGVFSENVVIDKPLTLIGQDNQNTIIQSDGNGIGILIDGILNVAIKNLNINNFFRSIVLIDSGYSQILNCRISNSESYPICSFRSDYNEVIGNILSDNGYGILCEDSNNVFVLENTVINPVYSGIHIRNCYFANVSNNTIVESTYYGIYVYSSYYSNINNNTIIEASYDGIDIRYCRNTMVDGNDISFSLYGIYIEDLDNTTLTNNTISHTGSQSFYIVDSIYTNILNNSIEDSGNWGISFGEYDGVSHTATIDNNYISNSTNRGISINAVEHVTITNNWVLDSGSQGISCSNSEDAVITNNTVSNTSDASGIGVSNCVNAIINNNTIIDVHFAGIDIRYCSNTMMDGNDISLGQYGIYIEDLDNTTLTNNTISQTGYHGFYILDSIYTNILNNSIEVSGNCGIAFGEYDGVSHNATIDNNYISSSTNKGMYVNAIEHVTITNNWVLDSGSGITCSNSEEAVITNNTVSNASDASGIGVSNCVNAIINNNTIIEAHYAGIDIRDCNNTMVDGNDISFGTYGMYIEDLDNTTLTNNTISQTGSRGVYIVDSIYTNILNNSIEDSGNLGISLGEYDGVSHTATIDNNLISGSTGNGIYIGAIEHATITNNQILDNGYRGIEFRGSDCHISYNEIKGNDGGGIFMQDAEDITVEYNDISDQSGGITIYTSQRVIMTNNTISFNDNNGIALWATGGNININNNEITNNGNSGIYTYTNCLGPNYITDNLISYNNYGIVNGVGSEIVGNMISYNNIEGFYSDGNSEGNNISGNTIIYNGGWGMRFITDGDGNRIIDNDVSNNSGGIILSSNLNLVSGNIILDNQDTGIYLSGSQNTVENNTISGNGNAGIGVYGDENSICWNTILNNRWGFSLANALNNIIYHNNILDNTGQVYNYQSTNTWNNSANQGNYWSDYIGLDDGSNGRIAGDGIGDTNIPHPYIDKGYGYYQLDNYPLMGMRGLVYNVNKATFHLTIQEAIDLADAGNTLQIGIGEFNENVIVYKQLNLIGAGEGSSLVSGSGDYGFLVQGTSNVMIKDLEISNYVNGIKIDNSSVITLESNLINNNEYGIYIMSSENNSILYNTLDNNDYGIYIENASGNSISNNDIVNGDYGIYIDNEVTAYTSGYNPIQNNVINSNKYGIWIRYSTGDTITQNEIKYNTNRGIHLGYSDDITVQNNDLLDNGTYGIRLYDSSNIIISNNTIDNSNNGIYLFNASNNSIKDNNLKNGNYGIYVDGEDTYPANGNNNIEDNTIDGNNYGIWIRYSYSETIILNDITNNAQRGIHIGYSDYATVENNEIHYNGTYGIRLYRCSYSTIYDNSISNCEYGVNTFQSHDNEFHLNWIWACDFGIFNHGMSNRILANEIFNITWQGIYIDGWTQNLVENNSITDGGIYGIYLNSAPNTNIKYNTVSFSYYGIYLDGSRTTEGKVIERNTISSAERAIYLYDSDGYYIDTNYMLSGNHIGIYLEESNDVIVNSNQISNTFDEGIYLDNCTRDEIKYNTLTDIGTFGIYLDYSSVDNVLWHNTIEDALYGICLKYSSSNTLDGNTIRHCHRGIHMEYSDENIIIANSVWNSTNEGIYLYRCYKNSITWGDIYWNGIGIKFDHSGTVNESENIVENNYIWHNTNYGIYNWGTNHIRNNNDIQYNREGIRVYTGSYGYIKENNIENNSEYGIHTINSFGSLIIVKNTIWHNGTGIFSEDSMYHHIMENDIVINYQEGICLLNSNYVYIEDNNNISWNGGSGIEIYNSHDCEIGREELGNTIVFNDEYGIALVSSFNCSIVDNDINYNDFDGINIIDATDEPNILIKGNTIINNHEDGIYLISTQEIIILENYIQANDYNGIYMKGCLDTLIQGNDISRNSHCGIYLFASFRNLITMNKICWNNIGIYFSMCFQDNSGLRNSIIYNIIKNNNSGIVDPDSNYITISENIISENIYGIHIQNSENITITDNSISENEVGLYIDETSTDNTIHHNSFIDNEVQAEDDGEDNTWDDGEGEGNFWNDYEGRDRNKDGVGETPYGDLDQYPLIEPPQNVPPVADADGPYFGLLGEAITFDATDSFDCNDGDELQYRWDFDGDGEWDTDWSSDPTATHAWNDEYEGTIVVEVTDGEFSDTSSSYVFVKPLEATIVFDPETLNLLSEGEYVTVYIELPAGYDVGDIDLSTILLNGEVPIGSWPWEIGDEDEDGIPDLKVKFDRSAVQALLKVGKSESIVITGQLNDGTWFGGEDRIRVIKEEE